ncbi:Membrane protein involved in the export of O-antigen and teichoic acid [Microbacterium azadirachtae]|nr:Membrane protein involved in the export of O-antigen and teichoic acid [Microbacterium azadirachtae]SEG57290.1 Membrane protein involved in the export of O-antigen and teichoic acid [Microbacterium azadirachtae]SEG60237.1 Membrane protein involved in the export of O-antigen and teichoic acid [Microbacterium azadirachtae]
MVDTDVPARREGRSALRSIATLLTGTVASQVIGIVTMPLLSRIYGPAAFGVLAVFLSVSAVVSMVSALRYDYAIVLPGNDEDAHRLRQLSTGLVSLISALTVITTIAVFWLSRPTDRHWWVLLIGVSVFLAGETSILYFWLTRKRRYRAQSLSRIVQALITAATQAGLGWLLAPTGEWLIAGYLVGQVFGVGVLIAMDDARKTAPVRDRRSWWSLMVRYRKMPLLNAPNALVDSLRLNGINMIIGGRSLHALGQFSMAWKLAQAPMALIASAISQVYYQRMAVATPGTLKTLVRSVTLRALLLGFLPFLTLGLVAPIVVPWFLGAQWAEAGLVVQALTPWLYLNVATAPLSTVFIVAERQGTMLIFAIVYLVVPLTILLLAGADLVRAVWLTSAAMTLLLAFLIVLAHRIAARFDSHRLGSD